VASRRNEARSGCWVKSPKVQLVNVKGAGPPLGRGNWGVLSHRELPKPSCRCIATASWGGSLMLERESQRTVTEKEQHGGGGQSVLPQEVKPVFNRPGRAGVGSGSKDSLPGGATRTKVIMTESELDMKRKKNEEDPECRIERAGPVDSGGAFGRRSLSQKVLPRGGVHVREEGT